jgi:hypothetical protein
MIAILVESRTHKDFRSMWKGIDCDWNPHSIFYAQAILEEDKWPGRNI